MDVSYGNGGTLRRTLGLLEIVGRLCATDKMNGVCLLYAFHFARDWLEKLHTDTGKPEDGLIRGTHPN